MDEVEYRWRVYLTCDSLRRSECLNDLLSVDRASLLRVLSLPRATEERFRVYDLLVRLAPDGAELLRHVIDECRDRSDPLTQLAAIQFVYEHDLQDVDTFVGLFRASLDDALTLVPIGQTVAAMCARAADPAAHLDVVAQLVELAVGAVPDLLGALPPLTAVEPFARLMLASEAFQLWLLSVPSRTDMRTVNIYLRNLLARWCASPRELLLPAKALAGAITNPHAGLRTAAFDHIAIMAQHFRDELLAIDRLPERVADGNLDSTVEEVLARRRAMEALGMRIIVAPANGPAGPGGAGDMGPALMTI
jgi:hypothetical protein